MKGIKRFRQAIKNQRDAGEGEFRLAYRDAEEIAAEIEDELAQLAWANGVPVPVDANGEVVPLTTKVMYDRDGGKHEVNFYSFAPESGYWTVNTDKQSNSEAHVTEGFHLHRPDSWEKLEEDVQKVTKASDICGYYDNVCKPCNECPACNIPGMCSAIVLRDALRRAKALADRDAKEVAPQASPHDAKETDRG